MLSLVDTVIKLLFSLLSGVILISVILSWVPPLKMSAFGRLIDSIADPILSPVRKLIARSPLGGPGMMLDFSPVITLMLLQALSSLLQRFIYSI